MSLGCVYDNGICNRLSQQSRLNRLNERDLSLPVSISQSYIPGIDLNDVIFDNYGYVMNSTNALKDALDSGFRRLYLDVYWDTEGEQWHLCPLRPPPLFSNSSFASNSSTSAGAALATIVSQNSTSVSAVLHTTQPESINDIRTHGDHRANPSLALMQHNRSAVDCDYRFNFEQFVDALKDYIDLSDTNIAASLIHLHLRPKQWKKPILPSNATRGTATRARGQSSLNETLGSMVGSRILTPSELRGLQNSKGVTSDGAASNTSLENQWPSLKNFLYTNTDRMVVSYNDSLSSSIPDLKKLSSLAFAKSSTIQNASTYTVEELSMREFTDTFVTDKEGWVDAKFAGVSPVLSGKNVDFYSAEMLDLLEQHDYWAWAPQQPLLYTTQQREDMLSNGYSRAAQLAACAVFGESGLEVANCNSHFPVLCRHKSDHFDWTYTSGIHTYFDPNCPKSYSFSIPATPLEARLIRELDNNSTSSLAWVDFNSLYLTNCWVTGGTNAVCPYNIHQDGRNGIGFIAAAAAVSFFALLFIFLFEWDRGKSPLMRKSLKRNKKKFTEFEGVPS